MYIYICMCQHKIYLHIHIYIYIYIFIYTYQWGASLTLLLSRFLLLPHCRSCTLFGGRGSRPAFAGKAIECRTFHGFAVAGCFGQTELHGTLWMHILTKANTRISVSSICVCIFVGLSKRMPSSCGATVRSNS